MTTLSRDRMLQLAQDPQQTPFDYIVVGSGAGGGPLAARLALGGKSVLVLEAGADAAVPGAGGGDPLTTPALDPTTWREVYAVPGYCAAATDDPDMSWHFSVRHYDDYARQKADKKYVEQRDPSRGGGNGKGGIHYPRCAAVGGCTAHHAMVIVRPNDCDWERIADLTGDQTWRAAHMQGYFARLEKCLYPSIYRGHLRKTLGVIYRFFLVLASLINPRWTLDTGGHGFLGWQATSFISPTLLKLISTRDRTFTRLLFRVVLAALAGRRKQLLREGLALIQLFQVFDPNDIGQRRRGLSSLAFIPTGTDGVRRHGVRELLLGTASKHSDRLVIETGVHVERILFTVGSTAPKACGVAVAEGLYLYQASPKHPPGAASRPARKSYFAKQEVVICGGAFNTPQLLMLSGIGDQAALAVHHVDGLYDEAGGKVSGVVHLPGVGRNLQDRYEVSVISQASSEFSMLKGVTFEPGSPNDPAFDAWRNGEGIYTTNGCALALFLNSGAASPHPEVPDLFIFGIPAAFRGYYPGWSGDLLHATIGGTSAQRDLWTWVILKAYTNNRGTVTLRSNDPYEQPEIDFNYFKQGTTEAASDVEALSTGVAYVRWMNERTRGILSNEIQPGIQQYPDGSPALADWLCDEAWGHHACGTCRIGADAWQADTSKLDDGEAVLAGDFRVHGVEGLRVADASVFRDIPGYFLAAATFMVGEKAADTLLQDSIAYPRVLEAKEGDAICERRNAAQSRAPVPAGRSPGVGPLPADTVGLALSGGGIRSATFCLGVLQALAAKDRLREVDILSTVSGGGWTGSFLGRLFTTVNKDVADKVGYVQKLLADPRSAQIWWIRKHADYIAARGRRDWRINLGIYWRNLLAVYLCIGVLLVIFFGGARWLSDPEWRELGSGPEPQLTAQQAASQPPLSSAVAEAGGAISVQPARPGATQAAPTLLEKAKEKVPPSPWWWVPLAILFVGVVPLSLSFWLTPLGGTTGAYPVFPLLAWIALVAGAVAALSLPSAVPWAAPALAMLLLAWVWQEASRWRLPPGTPDERRSVIVRNRLGRYLGGWLIALLAASVLVLLDAVAWAVARSTVMPAVATTSGILVLIAPLARKALERLSSLARNAQGANWPGILGAGSSPAVGFVLALFLLFAVDVLVHVTFEAAGALGGFVVLLALVFSLIAGRAFDVLNRSSLQAAYAERLSRTFLGAANPARTHSTHDHDASDVQFAHPGDDLSFRDYHPQLAGGPLHLVNVCINETVDVFSERALRGDKGLPMCLGPAGVSVGRRFHARWQQPSAASMRGLRNIGARLRKAVEDPGPGLTHDALSPLPVAPDPDAFHVLGRRDGADAAVERLRLGQWMAISGAAFTTGMGRETRLPTALLRGLLNLRSGHWWDSGIDGGDRPGRYPPGLLRRLRSLPSVLFKMQFKILDEWRARFAGPSDRHWHLTDGGHFENTGLYELVRRRLPLIIAVDATADPQYRFDDMAILERQVRTDFNAQFCWIDPTPHRRPGLGGWAALLTACGSPAVPGWIQSWFDPDAFGAQAQISRTGSHAAALARITYDDAPGKETWLVLVKPSVPADMPLDVRGYALENREFPNDPTLNQFFTDAQWESYRKLGQSLGSRIFR